MNITDVDTHTALWNQVTPELRNGEELLWVGKPMPIRVVLANGELIGSLVGVIMIGVVLFLFGNFRMPTNVSSFSIFNLFPLIFIAFGLFTIARPIYEFVMATRTVYGLTNQRAIIIKQTFNGKKVESYTNSDQIERHDVNSTMGDLVFQRQISTYRSNGRRRTRTRKIGFFGVPEVGKVEALMLKVFAGEKAKNDFS